MPKRSHRRRIVLFLVAIVVPSLVLVVLSLRMISQERELTEKRLLDEQHRRANDIRQELLTHLERIKLKQVRALATQTNGISTADYGDPELVFVGLVENSQLGLPWEQNQTAEEFQQLLAEPAFARRIQQGEQEEVAAKQFGRAAALYREAMNVARKPAHDELAGATYTLSIKDGKLILQVRNGITVFSDRALVVDWTEAGESEAPLTPAFADAFLVFGKTAIVRFTRNQQNAVSGFTLTTGGVRRLRFNKL